MVQFMNKKIMEEQIKKHLVHIRDDYGWHWQWRKREVSSRVPLNIYKLGRGTKESREF